MKTESAWGLLIVLVILGLMGNWFFNKYIPGISYSYPAVCISVNSVGRRSQLLVQDNKCKGELFAYIPGRTGYKVIPSNQLVLQWNVAPRNSPSASKDCVVVDRLNWKCDEKTLGISIGMTDGDYYENGYLAQNEVFVGKWKWWFLRLTFHGMDDKDIAHLNVASQ